MDEIGTSLCSQRPNFLNFLAGGSLLAEDNNTRIPGQGGFVTSTVSFTALNADPRLGMPLEIRLSLVTPSVRQTNFDNVRLEGPLAAPVPEPSNFVLMGLGGGAAMLLRLFRRRRCGGWTCA
jgi:hypothetical protein